MTPKIIKRIELAEMPYDRFSNGRFVHATGDMIVLDDGRHLVEYEDIDYSETDDCIYEKEEG